MYYRNVARSPFTLFGKPKSVWLERETMKTKKVPISNVNIDLFVTRSAIPLIVYH